MDYLRFFSPPPPELPVLYVLGFLVIANMFWSFDHIWEKNLLSLMNKKKKAFTDEYFY